MYNVSKWLLKNHQYHKFMNEIKLYLNIISCNSFKVLSNIYLNNGVRKLILFVSSLVS